MKTHAFRLVRGQDLKLEIEHYCKQENIKAGYVASCVGCVDEVSIRLADGKSLFHDVNRYEIVSLMGTLSCDGVHLHIALSNDCKETIGGHLMKGCFVNTTAEIILHELDDFVFTREFDESTGYDEIVMSKLL